MSDRSGGTAAVSESDASPRAVVPRLAVPLLFLSLLFVGAVPFYVRQPFEAGESVSDPMWVGGSAFLTAPETSLYWLIAVPVCIGAVAVYCGWSERRSGITSKVRLWLVASLGSSVLTIVLLQGGLLFYFGNLTIRGLVPLLTLSAAVLVWGVGLRSLLLTAVGAVAVAASLVSNLYDVENLVPREWAFDSRFSLCLNIMLTASVFVVGAVASGFAERSRR
ncbi:hypothetical protein [Rhodococcus sp. 15-649-2-2]|uniref:hypothetical protein n=1 Tax=Rhodococcus sp. 15-649-2-2 TaxID=2023140 RepID=UPI00117A5004|nr:hypothetical protein [Rhodococcus sp. 15-649-2-2]